MTSYVNPGIFLTTAAGAAGNTIAIGQPGGAGAASYAGIIADTTYSYNLPPNYNWPSVSVYGNNAQLSVSRISDILKGSILSEVLLCKSKEECQQKYGEYGLKLFESLLNEILQNAIKSEEIFLSQLQKEKDKFEKLKQAVIDRFGDDSTEFQLFLLSAVISF
jgi:hypothetical protein